MVPSAFVWLPGLPLTSNGKVDSRALPKPEAIRGREGYEPPRPGLETILARLWADLLGVERVGRHDDFFALGGHSLLAVRLAARIRQVFGSGLAVSKLFEDPTLAGLAEALGCGGSWSPLVTLQAHGDLPPLFLIHPAGGQVWAYRPLAEALGGRQPVHALQGNDDADPPPSVQDMAAGYVAAVRAVQPRGPYRLAGWSFGGLVAFEMARQLAEAGEGASHLFLLDSWLAASAPVDQRLADQALEGQVIPPGIVAGLVERMARMAPTLDLGGLDGLAPRARLESLLDLATKAALAEVEAELELWLRVAGMLDADIRLAQAYRGGPYAGPVTLLRASEVPGGADPAPAWQALAPTVQVHDLPGDHFSLLAPENVGAVATVIAQELAKGAARVEAA